MAKTVHLLLVQIKTSLRDAGVESWELEARILLQYALSISREELIMSSQRIVSESEENSLMSFVARRLQHEPVTRIMGERGFWKSDFKLSSETLDPRADSETVVESVVRCFSPAPESVLDLGTGSGCLLLSLLQEFPKALGIGVDVSDGAVKTAEENAVALHLSGRAQFLTADWATLKLPQTFDVIVSNPPYITADEMKALAPEVALHDPVKALFGGEDGLDAYRIIVSRMQEWLNPCGCVFFEIGSTQAKAVKDLLEQAGFSVLEVVTDLAGHDRCVIAKKA